jgi:hypothetical protein
LENPPVRLPLLAAVLTLTAAPAMAESAAPFLVSESGKGFNRLSEAVDAIGDGDGTILIAPGTYADCVVQTAGRVAFVARQNGTVTFDGGVCEGKATLVLRGRGAHVQGVKFTHEEVSDGNGAGIRLENGNLSVVGVSFVDAQCGILSGDDVPGAITVDRSSFAGLGKDPRGHGAHSMYIGRSVSLKVTNSRFERGTGGHYIKSRARHIEVLDSSFDDSRGKMTNYSIDLPNGATGRIAGNAFVNGLGKENRTTFISVAPEGRETSSTGLVIENNKAWLVPNYPWQTAFVANWTSDQVIERNNTLAPGIVQFKRMADSGARKMLRQAYYFLSDKAHSWLDA